jgi:hypothetical protein
MGRVTFRIRFRNSRISGGNTAPSAAPLSARQRCPEWSRRLAACSRRRLVSICKPAAGKQHDAFPRGGEGVAKHHCHPARQANYSRIRLMLTAGRPSASNTGTEPKGIRRPFRGRNRYSELLPASPGMSHGENMVFPHECEDIAEPERAVGAGSLALGSSTAGRSSPPATSKRFRQTAYRSGAG